MKKISVPKDMNFMLMVYCSENAHGMWVASNGDADGNGFCTSLSIQKIV